MSVSVLQRHTSTFGLVVTGILAMAAIAAMIPLVILPLGWKEQAIFGAAMMLIAILLDWTSRSPTVTMLLMTFSIFSTLRYGYWRVIQTWEGITSAGHIHRWENIFVVLLLIAQFFAFSTLILGYFQTLRPLGGLHCRLKEILSIGPQLILLVPTYNEPLHVVRGTVLAARAIDYPPAS